MFSLIRLFIWLVGFAVVSYFVLGYFGYQVNLDYFQASKDACQKELLQCQKDLVKSGVEGAREKCHIECIDPSLIIKREE
jgi:type VI protein secretion system component VasF